MSPGRRLSAEERALWARVAATVKPLAGRAVASPDPVPFAPSEVQGLGRAQPRLLAPLEDASRLRSTRTDSKPANTLDGGWDRRLRQGVVTPDRTIDLHGHTLTTAHAALDHALARAIADDVRVLLVVTGKPPRPDDTRRGLIRASIGEWLSVSPYRDRIAAVRHAHPRHGGAGALYLILRRRRGE